MILEPIYAENIIVGVIYNNKFKWYVTERELWFMDYYKLDSNNEEIDDEDLPDERQGLSVLNSDNANIFLQRIIENEASIDGLNNLLCKCIENRIEKDEVLNYSPCLLVNFDDKTLLSIYPELISFENYRWKNF